MSIITPSDTALAYLAQLNIGQQRFDISEMSETTGHTATRLGGPPRWTAALRTLDAMEPAVSALWKAISVQLRGRQNHLALYDVTQPAPRGTARGSITLSSTAGAGSSSLQLAGCRGANALLGASFELDSNADGLADGWARYTNGTTGSLAQSLEPFGATDGGKSQFLSAAALGVAESDRNGVVQSFVPVAQFAGKSVWAGGWFTATTGTSVVLYVYFQTSSGGGYIAGADIYVTAVATGGLQYLQVQGVCPSNATHAWFHAYQHSGSGGLAVVYIDGLQFVDTVPSAYPLPGTLLAGDWLQVGDGVGSHYCIVVADAIATDAGAITVTVEPPLRKAFSSGTAVTWDKPRAHYKQKPDAVSWSGAAGSAMVGGFAFDLMEDWTA